MPAKRPTLTDVAKLAGVGASTVSRHLRGIRVSAAVAQEIARAIDALGYHPDETARALRVGRTRTIGVVIPQVNNMFYAQVMQLLEEEARKRGCAVILLSHQETLEQQAMQLATIRRYRADGLILAPAAGSTAKLIHDALPHTPVVTLDRMLPGMDCVVLRNHDAARTATDHLLQHGYKRVAAVCSRPEITSFQHRLAGYKEAMALKKLPVRLIEAPNHDQLRYNLSAILLERQRPDALLCFSNRVSQTVLQTFDELALSREMRLPMLGFDDFELASLVDPPLSVVRQPTENMVRHAVNILFERIGGNETMEVQNIALPGQLIYRRSCGCH